MNDDEAATLDAIATILRTRCPSCRVGIGDWCTSLEPAKFHPARARRAATKVKLQLIDCEAA